jgi:ATP-binding cassette subfamily B protein RaxB
MNLLQHINLSRAPRLPLVLASEVSECGLACIAMIARFHGHDIDLNGLRQRFALSLSGMSLRSLMGLADQLGLASRPLRVELAALSKVKTPAILHWDLNHYVVLRSVTSRSIVIHDPALGVRTVPLAEVSKHFTGVVLELAPATNFRVVHARAPVRFTDPALPRRIATPAFTSAGSLRVRNRPICLFCNLPSSILSLTSRPPRRSASNFRQSCLRWPTR